MKDIPLPSYHRGRPKVKIGPYFDNALKGVINPRLLSFEIDGVTYSFFISDIEKAIQDVKDAG